MEHFDLRVTPEEKDYLRDLAKYAIAASLEDTFSEEALLQPPDGYLHSQLGAFVTLKKCGKLRGCIGRLIGDAPLYVTVCRMAQAAAFHDSRFPPLQAAEYPDIDVEISIMGPITPCHNPEQIVIGTHGLIMRKDSHQGLLLPQVAKEQKWSVEVFLQQVCLKAGLQGAEWKDAWKVPQTELYWFEAIVF